MGKWVGGWESVGQPRRTAKTIIVAVTDERKASDSVEADRELGCRSNAASWPSLSESCWCRQRSVRLKYSPSSSLFRPLSPLTLPVRHIPVSTAAAVETSAAEWSAEDEWEGGPVNEGISSKTTSTRKSCSVKQQSNSQPV